MPEPITPVVGVASPTPTPPTQANLRAAYEAFVLGADHPCVMAQTVFRDARYTLCAYGTLACARGTQRLLDDLGRYIADYDPADAGFQTFVAAFPQQPGGDEHAFEADLWALLQRLHDLDPAGWDPSCSSDPSSDTFSLSLHGRAFYIVGLHPDSSRLARRAPYATVVFNLHDQFERLRGMGAYRRVRDRIRRRDLALQGSVNPMVEDFGSRSEARQYSGRAVGEAWRCPFLARSQGAPSPR